MMNVEYEYRLDQNIRLLRESLQLTQNELSAQLQLCGCDITRSALAKIEVGQRHIYPDEIVCLRKLLNTTYDKLFPSPDFMKSSPTP